MDTPDGNRAEEAGRSRRIHGWAVATGVLVLAGIAGSLAAASSVAENQTDRASKSFLRRSTAVASTLQLAIQHENDVVVDASGLAAADPELSRTWFRDWATAAHVLGRYPEMDGIAVLELVDHADLPRFAAGAETDPDAKLGPDGRFDVLPPGPRATYCLVAAGVSADRMADTSAEVDYCADPRIEALLLQARDSGSGLYVPYEAEGRQMLAIQTPIYRGGVTPVSVPDRRAAFVGWVATQIDPAVVLERAVRDEPGMTVSLQYADDITTAEFSYREPREGSDTTTIGLGNGWTMRTSSVVETGKVLKGDALLLLIAGVAVSVLLGLLVFVLATGRERARRQLEARTRQLHHQALHDALTGLPNRALVLDRAEQMLERHRRGQAEGAALFLDLDDFKNINDTLGHGAGDELLVAVAARLSGTLRGGDTIGRMGGDEFVVLLDGSAADVAPALVAERLLDVLRQPFDLPGARRPITVNVSIGIACGDRATAGELLRDADLALYRAKGEGKNRYAMFDPTMHSDLSRRNDLEFELRSALGADQFRLVYQPIYRLDDLSMVGVEALLRWHHPVRGVVTPDEFIPILEETGQIVEVGRWVLREACRQVAEWQVRDDRLTVSVNVSVHQLEDDDIVQDIRAALALSGLAPDTLVIEVTESVLMRNIEAIAARLQAIKALGVRVAVDDFGTGYSSLAYLRQFPVDCLKIDRAFTTNVDDSSESRALVSTLVQLGKALGLSTLAEGVETGPEMDALRAADVDQAQGFLMARPLDPVLLEAELLGPGRRPGSLQPT